MELIEFKKAKLIEVCSKPEIVLQMKVLTVILLIDFICYKTEFCFKKKFPGFPVQQPKQNR